MACTAAYTGLRQGELFALTAGQIDPAARVIDVDRKVIEVGGKLLTGAPKGRKRRKTIYPVRTPQGYPLAEKIAARIQAARAEQNSRHQPAGADVPLPPRHLLAVLQLRPPRPGPRLPGGRLARPRRQRPPGPGTACGTCCAPPPCSPGNSTPPTSRPWPGTPTSAPPWTCTSAPPPASSTAPAQPPNDPTATKGLVRAGSDVPASPHDLRRNDNPVRSKAAGRIRGEVRVS